MPEGRALFIHGAGGGGGEWDLWMAVWQAAGVACHAPDLMPAADGLAATRLQDYLAQLEDELQALARPRVVVGASLGGLLALQLAGAANAVIVVNPIPPAPWHARLPPRTWTPIEAWGRRARLASTRRALPDADAASVLHAFRRWRDESGAVLAAAHAGVAVGIPRCPVLALLSQEDADVPPSASLAWARAWGATVMPGLPGGHVGPLLGSAAVEAARRALGWWQSRGQGT